MGHEIFLRVSELCNDMGFCLVCWFFLKKGEYSEWGKMVNIVKTIMKTGKLIIIATVKVKAESLAMVCWMGFFIPRDPA